MGRMIAIALMLASGCIGTSPEAQVQDDLGPYDDGDMFHRPGQPCVACHGEDFNPGGDVFVVAGTVYLNETDSAEFGVAGAQVILTDAAGREFTAITNRVGSFAVQPGDPDEREDDDEDEGKVKIGFDPLFPLNVRVIRDGVEQVMRSRIYRDGSCASCHRRDVAEDSTGQVYIVPEGG